jgi:hypothetical protein
MEGFNRRCEMRRSIGVALAIATLMTVVFGQQGVAEAGRGIIIYHSGDDVFPAGPLPEPYSKLQQLKGAEAAFKCSIFGLFWAYFHIWDCKPVAVKGDTYYEDAELAKAVAAKYKQSDMKVGLWTKHGRWVFAAALIGLVVMGFLGRGKDDDEEDDASEDEPSDDESKPAAT